MITLDLFPLTATEQELLNIAPDLGVARADGEAVDTFRARVLAAWVELDTPPAPRPMVLGGMKLG